MDSLSAFAMGQANRGKTPMVFDWNKAAQLIKESGMKDARAGLANDWEWTGGDIFKDGKPVLDGGCYLSSTWARPELEIDGEEQDCFVSVSDTDNWGPNTVWPESALAILNS